MSITFKSAPLVEMIAELRWGAGAKPVIQPPPPMVMQGMGPDLDQFFIKLGDNLSQHGFRRAERLVPSGFPIFPFQPIFRFRRDVGEDNSVVIQSGAGLFSVHAVPPYRSWAAVSTVVKNGVSALLASRASADQHMPFSVLSLMYINAFGPNLTSGRAIGPFMRDVLGVSIQLPPTFFNHLQAGSEPKQHVQLSFPLTRGGSMSFSLGDGNVNNESVIVMDMRILRQDAVSSNVEAIMDAFTSSRDVIHSIFLDLIKPIHDLLEPIEEKSDA